VAVRRRRLLNSCSNISQSETAKSVLRPDARKYVKFQKFVTVCPKGNNNVLTPFLNKFSSEYSFLNTISLICFATHNIGIRTRYCMRYHVVANQNSTLQQFSFPRGDLNTFSLFSTPFLNKFSSEYSFLNTISLICFATHDIGIRTRYCMRYHVVANQNSTLQQFSFPRGDLNTFS
jgi:hypothetical protein